MIGWEAVIKRETVIEGETSQELSLRRLSRERKVIYYCSYRKLSMMMTDLRWTKISQ